jgi:DNA-binding transcriptional LysR family regulator
MTRRHPHDEPWLTASARPTLARGLHALHDHPAAPLRVRAHARGGAHDVFDLQEEFELGPRGRRFIISVDPAASEALLLAVGGGAGVGS